MSIRQANRFWVLKPAFTNSTTETIAYSSTSSLLPPSGLFHYTKGENETVLHKHLVELCKNVVQFRLFTLFNNIPDQSSGQVPPHRHHSPSFIPPILSEGHGTFNDFCLKTFPVRLYFATTPPPLEYKTIYYVVTSSLCFVSLQIASVEIVAFWYLNPLFGQVIMRATIMWLGKGLI